MSGGNEGGTPKLVPGSNVPEVSLELEKHEGCWAVRIRGKLFTFPSGVSKKDAERALALGISLYKQRLN